MYRGISDNPFKDLRFPSTVYHAKNMQAIFYCKVLLNRQLAIEQCGQSFDYAYLYNKRLTR